jgi:hypothetical protein
VSFRRAWIAVLCWLGCAEPDPSVSMYDAGTPANGASAAPDGGRPPEPNRPRPDVAHGVVVGAILRGDVHQDDRPCLRASPQLVAIVTPLVELPSRTQREAAFTCLRTSSSVDAVPALLKMFEDARFSEDDGTAACAPSSPWDATIDRLLPLVGPEHTPLILAAYDTCTREEGRKGLADMLFKVARLADLDAIKDRLAYEREGTARFVLTATLARLGDHEARMEFSERFRKAGFQSMCGMLRYADQVRGPWLLPELARLLRRVRPDCLQVFVSHDQRFAAKMTSDYAVHEIALVTGHKFSFDLDRHSFTAAERREVETYVRTLLAQDAGPK